MLQKRLFTCLIVLMSFWQLSAQPVQLYIRFNDGTFSAFPLVEIKKISFESDFIKLQLSNGTSYSWAAATIDHYKYDNITSVKEISQSANSWDLKVIPNPSEGRQLLRFRLPVGGDAVLKVFDAAGKLVYEKLYSKLPAGEQELGLDGPVLPGNYRLQLPTHDFVVSKSLIRL
jgi:hypothetical protein